MLEVNRGIIFPLFRIFISLVIMPRRSKTPIRKRRSQEEDDRLEESFINTLNTSLNMLQSKNGTELEEYQAKQNRSNYNEKTFFVGFTYNQWMWFIRILFWLLFCSLFSESNRRFVATNIKSFKQMKWVYKTEDDQYLMNQVFHLLREGGDYLVGIFLYYSGWRVGPVWVFNFLVLDIYHYFWHGKEATRIDNELLETMLKEMKHIRVNISLNLLDLHENDDKKMPEINMRTLDEDRCKYCIDILIIHLDIFV